MDDETVITNRDARLPDRLRFDNEQAASAITEPTPHLRAVGGRVGTELLADE